MRLSKQRERLSPIDTLEQVSPSISPLSSSAFPFFFSLFSFSLSRLLFSESLVKKSREKQCIHYTGRSFGPNRCRFWDILGQKINAFRKQTMIHLTNYTKLHFRRAHNLSLLFLWWSIYSQVSKYGVCSCRRPRRVRGSRQNVRLRTLQERWIKIVVGVWLGPRQRRSAVAEADHSWFSTVTQVYLVTVRNPRGHAVCGPRHGGLCSRDRLGVDLSRRILGLPANAS